MGFIDELRSTTELSELGKAERERQAALAKDAEQKKEHERGLSDGKQLIEDAKVSLTAAASTGGKKCSIVVHASERPIDPYNRGRQEKFVEWLKAEGFSFQIKDWEVPESGDGMLTGGPREYMSAVEVKW